MNQAPEPPKPFVADKKIIVAGAGIAGLSFVVALRKQWESENPSFTPPTITIYERDRAGFGTDREGYSISIRSDGYSAGVRTLQKLGLLDSLLEKRISGNQEKPGAYCLWNSDWKCILRTRFKIPQGLPVASPRVQRNILRAELIEGLSEQDHIQWGSTCIGAKKLHNGQVQALLDDSPVEECDLLIAADGAKSKIRMSVRPEDALNFAGLVYIMGWAKFPSAEEVSLLVNKDWGRCLGGDGVGLFVGPVDETSEIWSLSYISPQTRTLLKQPLSPGEAEGLLKEALERGETFKEPYRTLVQATDLATLALINAMDKRPFPHTTRLQDEGIVFIGDANHAVSPLAGNGANMALMDGWNLAEQLRVRGSLSNRLAAYDPLSVPRAEAIIRISHRTIEFAHAQGWRLKLYAFVFRILDLLSLL